jgi:hypothetical protein
MSFSGAIFIIRIWILKRYKKEWGRIHRLSRKKRKNMRLIKILMRVLLRNLELLILKLSRLVSLWYSSSKMTKKIPSRRSKNNFHSNRISRYLIKNLSKLKKNLKKNLKKILKLRILLSYIHSNVLLMKTNKYC